MEDDYMGSYRSWEPESKERLIKTIIKDSFDNREAAYDFEAKLISESINNKLNRNYHIPKKGFRMDGQTHSAESRQKMSAVAKGKPKTENHKIKISEANKGRSFSEDHKKKISEGKKGGTPWNKGKKRPPFSDEWKRKIGDAIRGRTLTEEQKRKIGGNFKGRTHTLESKEKNRLAHLGKNLNEDHKKKIAESLKGNKRALGMKHTDETKRKLSVVAKDKKWITNGIICKYISKTDPVPTGFRYGKLYTKRNLTKPKYND
jgi:hypothetical protein